MGLHLDGDFAGLANFQAKLAAAPGLPKRVAVEAIPELRALVAQEFSASEDPYGNPWIPLKTSGPPLQPLSDEVRVTLVGGAAIRISTHGYLNFHNAGTHNIGKRSAAKKLRGELKARTSAARLSGELKGKVGRGKREALALEKKSVKETAAKVSAASGYHDPPRPVIPNDAASIPQKWAEVLDKVASNIIAGLGAQ